MKQQKGCNATFWRNKPAQTSFIIALLLPKQDKKDEGFKIWRSEHQ